MGKRSQIQIALDELMEKRKALLDQVTAYDAAIMALNHAQKVKQTVRPARRPRAQPEPVEA